MWGLVAAVVAVGAIAYGAAKLFNSGARSERRRQERLQRNYEEYESASNARYAQILRNRDGRLESMRRQTAHELYLARMAEIAERKERNRRNFDVLIEELNGQIEDWQGLREQISQTIDCIKKGLEQAQCTALRRDSLKSILSEAYESLARQKAYVGYLNKYKKTAEKNFDRSGELMEPFQVRLPENVPYVGRVMAFEREELQGGEFEREIHPRVGYKFLCTDAEELERLFPNDEIIFCLDEGFDGETYVNKISCVKGMFIHKFSLNPDAKITAVVDRRELNEDGTLSAYILKSGGLELRLPKKSCRERYPAPVGSKKDVYVRNFDRKSLSWIDATERLEECLDIKSFHNVPLLIRRQDLAEFQSTAKKRDALSSYEEWYLGPILQGDETKYKCQLGNRLVFQASFTGGDSPFGKFLPDTEMFGANDIFVALDAEIRAYIAENAADIPAEFLEESTNLCIYINTEFAKQSRIKENQANVLYFNQWSAVMERLVRVKESGGFIDIAIDEQIAPKIFAVAPEDIPKLKKFYYKQISARRKRPEFFILLADEKKAALTISGNFSFVETNFDFGEDFLTETGYTFEINVREFPYPEIQQRNALKNFRLGIMESPSLKEAIFDLARLNFNDTGIRPSSIRNASITKNPSQMQAVIRAMSVKDFFMIQGPPGTGKTTVIKEIVWQQMRLNPDSRILIVSQANVAVDNVLRGLPVLGIPTAWIVRCGNDEKISDEMKNFSLEHRLEQYDRRLENPVRADLQHYRDIWRAMLSNSEDKNFIGEYLLKNFAIVGATCVGLAAKHFGLDQLSFDLIIADEAGKAAPGELLLPVNRAKKVIIIGDHKQLPPVIDPIFFDKTKINVSDILDDEDPHKFFETSLFEKLYESCPDDNKCMLNLQFRMPLEIGQMVSALFYDGRLNSAVSCAKKFPLFFGNNLVLLNMDGDENYHEFQEPDSGPYNPREAEITVALLQKIRASYQNRIAVITPYKNQNRKLRKALEAAEIKNVAVNTIDAFQGDEADIVIYCTTRARNATDYFSNAARLNVAFSRARNLLVIVGSLNYFRKYPAGHALPRIARYVETNGRIISHKEFFAEDFRADFAGEVEAAPAGNFDSNTEISLSAPEVENYVPVGEKAGVECKICRRRFDAAELTEGICIECLSDGEIYQCQHCKTEMFYSNAQKYVYKTPKPELCENCQIIWRHPCKRCGTGEVVVRAINLKNNPGKREEDFPYCSKCLKERGEKIIVGSCKSCGKPIEFARGKVEDLQAQGKAVSEYCYGCNQRRNEMVIVGHCKNCGKSLEFRRWKYEQMLANGARFSSYCNECREKEVFVGFCSVCNSKISISYGKKEDFERKGFAMPKKCPKCKQNSRY